MEDNSTRGASLEEWTRRTYLVAAAGSAAGMTGLSGCATGDEETPEEEDEELPEGVTAEEFERGPVPEVYMTALSLGMERRDPDDLRPKADVQFSEYEEATENEAHEPGTVCANCAEFIPDKNGDTFGACAKVEGYIDGADWCTIYEALPEPSVPEGMSENELATAEVPESYRTAQSQGGEERVPDDLRTQEAVSLTESVEALAEGDAQPGQSCGNCAEFIPDKNGDTWGACAKVGGTSPSRTGVRSGSTSARRSEGGAAAPVTGLSGRRRKPTRQIPRLWERPLDSMGYEADASTEPR